MRSIYPSSRALSYLTLKIGLLDQTTSRKSYFQKIISTISRLSIRRSATSIIPFNQYSDIIIKLDAQKHKTLLQINYKFNGLCDLICNRILIDNILGCKKGYDFIRKHINIVKIDDYRIKNGHILDLYSLFHKIIAFLFGVYPDNIFSYSDQWKLINIKTRTVNRELLKKGLKNIKEGESLKLEVFTKSNFNLSGHSLLIKKMANNTYAFFDPNSGEHQNLTFNQLGNHIDKQIKLNGSTDIFIMRDKDYFKRLGKRIGPIFLAGNRKL